MLAIDVELLHGAVRAAPATDETLTGVATEAEWPLSPARLFSAFVASDGTGERCRVTDGTELTLLEQAAPPVILAEPDTAVVHNRLRERFVVLDERSGDMTQGYPARRATLVRPGTRVDPRTARLTYVFEDVDPTDEQLLALRRRAARIGYVGCADSPARVRVNTRLSDDVVAHSWHAGVPGTALPVPYAGLLEALDRGFAAEQAGGVNRRSWIPSEFADYGDPEAVPLRLSGQTYVLVLDRRVAGHKALLLTETLRRAVLAAAGDDAPALLHGHGLSGSGHLQARYLALPFAGREHADGDIRAVAVWLPSDTLDVTDTAVRAALLDIDELRGRGIGRRRVRPAELAGDRLWTADVDRWSALPRGARVWRSVTPVVHERHATTDLSEVQRWFEHAGHPAPSAFRTMRLPFVPAGVRLRPSDLRPRYGSHPFSHLEVTFDEPVAGPLVVGRGRQFGLGLLAPAAPAEAERGARP